MTSIRLSRTLLELLHQAAPRGVPLAAVVQTAVAAAGGPAALRARLEAPRRRQAARAGVRRRLASRDRSVWLSPDHQVGLAEAAGAWCRLMEREGTRRVDPVARTLWLSAPPARPTMRRDALRARRGLPGAA